MLFGVDIDFPCARDTNQYAQALNQELGLAIPEEQLNQVSTFTAFLMLPQVASYLQASEENRKHFRAIYDAIGIRPSFIQSLPPAPGAVAALRQISQEHHLVYVTCRRTDLRTTTLTWLKEHHFPHPETVYHCDRYHDKFLQLAQLAEPNEKIILIDDHAREIVLAFPKFLREHYRLAKQIYKRLAILAFGQSHPPSIPFRVPFPVLALRDWEPEALNQLLGLKEPI